MKTKQFLRAFGSLFFILCAITLNAGEHPTLKERIILAAEKNGITVSDFSEGKISENPQFSVSKHGRLVIPFCDSGHQVVRSQHHRSSPGATSFDVFEQKEVKRQLRTDSTQDFVKIQFTI